MKLDRRLMVIAAGMAALAVSGAFDPADAQDSGVGARGLHGAAPARAHAGHASRGRGDPGHADRDRHVEGAHAGRGNPDRRRGLDRRATDTGVGVNVDVPLTYDAYASRGGSCRSLRMRAEVTGSGYWWGRYQACRDGRDD